MEPLWIFGESYLKNYLLELESTNLNKLHTDIPHFRSGTQITYLELGTMKNHYALQSQPTMDSLSTSPKRVPNEHCYAGIIIHAIRLQSGDLVLALILLL